MSLQSRLPSLLTIHPKVTGATAAGAATLIGVWSLSTFTSVVVPGDVAAAFTLLLTFLGGWAVGPNRSAG